MKQIIEEMRQRSFLLREQSKTGSGSPGMSERAIHDRNLSYVAALMQTG